MSLRKFKILICALFLTFLISSPSHADVFIGYNPDGTPKYGPEPIFDEKY
jgi:hypothetical protein